MYSLNIMFFNFLHKAYPRKYTTLKQKSSQQKTRVWVVNQ